MNDFKIMNIIFTILQLSIDDILKLIRILYSIISFKNDILSINKKAFNKFIIEYTNVYAKASRDIAKDVKKIETDENVAKKQLADQQKRFEAENARVEDPITLEDVETDNTTDSNSTIVQTINKSEVSEEPSPFLIRRIIGSFDRVYTLKITKIGNSRLMMTKIIHDFLKDLYYKGKNPDLKECKDLVDAVYPIDSEPRIVSNNLSLEQAHSLSKSIKEVGGDCTTEETKNCKLVITKVKYPEKLTGPLSAMLHTAVTKDNPIIKSLSHLQSVYLPNNDKYSYSQIVDMIEQLTARGCTASFIKCPIIDVFKENTITITHKNYSLIKVKVSNDGKSIRLPAISTRNTYEETMNDLYAFNQYAYGYIEELISYTY